MTSQWCQPALLTPLGGYCQIFSVSSEKFYFCTNAPVEVAKVASRIWLLCVTHLNITPTQNIPSDTTINNFCVNSAKKSLWRVRKILWLLFHTLEPFLLHFLGGLFFCCGLSFFSLQVFVTILRNTKDNNVKPYKQCEQCDKLRLITMSPWE